MTAPDATEEDRMDGGRPQYEVEPPPPYPETFSIPPDTADPLVTHVEQALEHSEDLRRYVVIGVKTDTDRAEFRRKVAAVAVAAMREAEAAATVLHLGNCASIVVQRANGEDRPCDWVSYVPSLCDCRDPAVLSTPAPQGEQT